MPRKRLGRYVRGNDMEIVRPVVRIDEVPWGAIRDPALVEVYSPGLRWLEGHLRRLRLRQSARDKRPGVYGTWQTDKRRHRDV